MSNYKITSQKIRTMPDFNDINNNEAQQNEYKNLINQVDASIQNTIQNANQSNENGRIPFEDYKHHLALNDIKPIIERNPNGELELNYKVERFNDNTLEHEVKNVRGIDLTNHKLSLEKVDTRPVMQDFVQREQLNKDLINNALAGQKIEVKYEEQSYRFKVPGNPDLTQRLNDLPNDKALDIANKSNNYIDNRAVEKIDLSPSISFENELKPNDDRENKLKL